jgi:hypothetical protein
MSIYLGKNWENATQMTTVTHEEVKVSRGEWKGLAINFTWTILSPLWMYLMTSTQELLTGIEMSDRTVKECWGTLTIRH